MWTTEWMAPSRIFFFFLVSVWRVLGNYINVKQYNQTKNMWSAQMFGRRRKAEMNSSRLGMLCKLIKQRTDNSILHCKNKREYVLEQKNYVSGNRQELEGGLTDKLRTMKGTELMGHLLRVGFPPVSSGGHWRWLGHDSERHGFIAPAFQRQI